MAASDGSPCSVQDVGGSSLSMQAPKFGMLIPNRVFVGGIASNTSEAELKQFFTAFGPVKDCKIILDRAGVSKGYGFVTFELQEDVEKLMKREGEHILFKDRKLNIGPAIRKQQALPRVLEAASLPHGVGGAAATAAVLYAAGGVPYTFQNGLAMFHPGANPGAAASVPDGYTLATLPQMAIAAPPVSSFQQMLVSQQQQAAAAAYLTSPTAMSPTSSPAAYYQTQSFPGWAAAAAGVPQWPVYAPGLLAGSGGATAAWQFGAGAGAAGGLPLAGTAAAPAGHGGQYYYSLSADSFLHGGLPHHEFMYATAGGTQFQTVELSPDGQLVPSHSNEGSILLDGSGAGGTMPPCSGSLQYIDMQYAAAAQATASDMTSNQQRGGAGGSVAQSYGIKRVLSVPRQVICTPPTSYGVYGASGSVMPPPVKIVAGLGGQRMVTKTVNHNDLQMIPKTQN